MLINNLVYNENRCLLLLNKKLLNKKLLKIESFYSIYINFIIILNKYYEHGLDCVLMNIRRKLLFCFLSLFLIPLVFTAQFYYLLERNISDSINLHLESVATIQCNRLSDIYKQNIRTIKLIANYSHLSLNFNQLLLTKGKASQETLNLQISQQIYNIKNSMAEINQINIYDLNGTVSASTNSKIIGLKDPKNKAFLKGFNGYQANLFSFNDKNEQILTLSGPLYLDGESVGIITVESNVNNILLAINDYTGLGNSGESLLAIEDEQKNALFIMPTRFNKTAALNLIIEKERLDNPITHAIAGIEEVSRNLIDYRNIPVLSVSRFVKEANWGLVVKMDKSEALSQLFSISKSLIILEILALVLVTYLAFYFSKRITRPLRTIIESVEEIAQGKLETKTNISSNDEIGLLANNLNIMAASLLENKKEIELKIAKLYEQDKKIKDNVQRLEQWQKSNFIGIYQYLNTGEVIGANDTFLQMLGYSNQELDDKNLNWIKLTPTEFAIKDQKAIEEINEKGICIPYEKEFIKKDGSKIPVLVSASAYGEDNKEYIVFVIDLTKNKQAESDLHQYKNIVSSSTDMIALLDKNFIYLMANDTYLSGWGEPPENVIGHHAIKLLGEQLFESVIKPYALKCFTGELVQFKRWFFIPTFGRCYMDVSYWPYMDEDNHIQGFIINLRDITNERKSQQALLRQSKEHLGILNSMIESVITIDENGIIHNFNKSAEILFGYFEEEILGKHVNELTSVDGVEIHPSILTYCLDVDNSVKANNIHEIEVINKNNQTFPIRIAIQEIPTNESETRRFIGSCVNLTDTRLQEEQLRRTQKMDVLGKLTSGIVHDFNNVLGLVIGYAEMLENSLKEDPKLIKHVHQIIRAGDRGAKLTLKLLSFSKFQTSKQTSININKLIGDDEELIRKTLTKAIELKLQLSPNLWSVKLEVGAFEDVLLNMCINASHAMPNGGHLTIATSNTSLSQNEAINLNIKSGDFVKLVICDSGCGMSAEVQQHIFDPFFTTKQDLGTGLGLTQVFNFTKETGGTINVESNVDLGTKFSLYFPKDVSNNKKHLSNNTLVKNLHGCEKILVVDDEVELCELAKLILQDKGYNVSTVYSAQEALKYLTENNIDLLITDIVMPSLNGHQLVDEVTSIYPDIKYLFVTGHLSEIDEFAQNLIINKPYSANELLLRVRQRLDNPTVN